MSQDIVGPRVGCGVAIVCRDRLLLVRRRREPEAGHWGLPGGKVDAFEPVMDAAVREIREELGILVRPNEMLCLVEQIDRSGGQHWIAPVYMVGAYEGVPEIREPDALSALDWFALDALPTPLTEATRQAVAALRRVGS